MKVASLDNLLFLLLIAAAALFQLFSTALKKKGDKSESDENSTSAAPKIPPPIRRAPAESDADRIRKFLEALGQPPSSAPPPPVVPRTTIPPRPLAPVRPPPVILPTWRLPREQQTKRDISEREIPPPEQPSRLQEIIPPPIPATVAPTFEVHEAVPVGIQQAPIIKTPVEAYASLKPFGVAKEPDFKTEIAALLGSKSRLREAIILREIFGPPRGLQVLDQL